jgi:hypothetical protein
MGMPRIELISETIQVEYSKGQMRPISFKWRGKEYRIDEVEHAWQDFGQPRTGPRRTSWRTRRHRSCYRVKAEDGNVYEIYLERSGSRRVWYLSKRILNKRST